MTAFPSFPVPRYFMRDRRWKLSDLLAYEAAIAGEPPPPPLPPEQERWLTAAEVRRRLSVSDMWLWRRLKEAEAAWGHALPNVSKPGWRPGNTAESAVALSRPLGCRGNATPTPENGGN